MINMAEQLNSKINKEFDEQLHLLSERFHDQPIQIAKQIAIMSTIHDAFKRDTADIVKALSLPELGRLLQIDNTLLYLMKLYTVHTAEPELIMAKFFKSILPVAEWSYEGRRVS